MTPREFAEHIWESSGHDLAEAVVQLESRTYERMIWSSGSFKNKLAVHDQILLELVRIDADAGLRGAVNGAAWRSPLKSETGLRELAREMGGKS